VFFMIWSHWGMSPLLIAYKIEKSETCAWQKLSRQQRKTTIFLITFIV